MSIRTVTVNGAYERQNVKITHDTKTDEITVELDTSENVHGIRISIGAAKDLSKFLVSIDIVTSKDFNKFLADCEKSVKRKEEW